MPARASNLSRLSTLTISCTFLTSTSLAQPWPILQQGHEDVDPLGRSLFNQPLDLRTPTGFEQVYDLGDGRLARIDGGLFAVFPRSTYTATPTGLSPSVPPGTIYYIGPPPGLAAPNPFRIPTPAARTAASTFAADLIPRTTLARPLRTTPAPITRPTRDNRMAPVPTHVPVAPARTIFTDDQQRQQIIETLIQRAREAERPQ